MTHWILLSVAAVVASLGLSAVGLPTPWLLGGLVAAVGFALARPAQRLRLPEPAFRGGQAVIGVLVGVAVDWGSLRDLGPDWLVVAAVACFSLVVSVLVGQLLVRRGVDRVTATFASIAGGAAGLTALSRDLGADERVVAVLQYLRLLVVLVTMPVVVAGVFGGTGTTSPLELTRSTLLVDTAYCAVAAVVGLLLAPRVKLPAPAILGPLLVAAALRAVPWFADAGVPPPLAAIGYLSIGVAVGLKFTVESLRSIARLLPAALLTIVVTLVACAALGWLLSVVTDQSPLDAYLATTPGGIYAVLGTATATGGDVSFVTASQVLRLLIILCSAPAVAAFLRRSQGPGGAAAAPPGS